MRRKRTALKRRNHLGTHKRQNPISAPLVQDKSYTVRRGLHMFPWGSSGSHYGNERGQIRRYRSLGKQEKSHGGVVYSGVVVSTKEYWNLISSFCRLLINSYNKQDSQSTVLIHICVVRYLQAMLISCAIDHRLQPLPYFFIMLASSTWHSS